ncbi:RWD-domain-containing protein [Aureobasidium sp. EXF-3400]|nr:RWD-domain-containing protein [Aureobasidium sp. EXF-12344]KAI4770095.1 RWD-domain-containing protein [Aureobasidium sp. EXF-3400]
MGREEQTEEREVLDSIFPEEITGSASLLIFIPILQCADETKDISETEYRVSIQLEVTEDEESTEEPPTLILSVSYPEDYPDVAPRLDLSSPPNAPKHKHLDIQEDKTKLLDGLTATIEENLGMAMVFTLVTTIKDEAELLIAERQQAVQAAKDMEAAEAEAEENRKFEGTKVTRETYLDWSRRFKEEMAEIKKKAEEQREAEEKKKKGAKEEKKMTGRELWESGIATRAFVDEDDDGADALEAMKKLKVEA